MVLSYTALFLAAFGAATLLPLQSEALLVALLLEGLQPPGMLLLVATTGNVLGSLVNWVLGRFLDRWRERRWFPVKPDALARAQQRYHRWGYWSLLASWLPVVGDPLTVIAGIMRESLWRFLLLVVIAKGGRYALLAAITL